MNVALRIDAVGVAIEEIRRMSNARLAELSEVKGVVNQVSAAHRHATWMVGQISKLKGMGDGTDGRIDHFIDELNKSLSSTVVNM